MSIGDGGAVDTMIAIFDRPYQKYVIGKLGTFGITYGDKVGLFCDW